jgi:hypothetical protein
MKKIKEQLKERVELIATVGIQSKERILLDEEVKS